jgi:hypothetical protein
MKILISNELWHVGQVEALLVFTQGKEAADDIPLTIRTATPAFPTLTREGIEPIVDGDLLPWLDLFPSVHIDSFAHRIRVTSMVEVTAWRQKYRAGLPIEFTQMALIFL